jgi:hypothetical protein
VTQGFAENYIATQGYIHSFDNNVTVYTGVFALNKEVSLETTAYFKYTVDLINPNFGETEGGDGSGGGGGDLEKRQVAKSLAAVSGASSAAASGGAASDTRNDLMGGFSHNFGNRLSVEIYYDYSQEKDYASSTPIVTFRKDLFEKNTSLALGYSKNMDRISGVYMTGKDNKDVNNYYLGVTQILSPVTITRAGYSRSEVRGFIPEGNRLVPVDGVAASTCTDLSATCLGEAFPDRRIREAVLAGINHYWPEGLFGSNRRTALKGTYRYYWDDWNIHSYTEEIEYDQYLWDQTTFQVNVRAYQQTGAFFLKGTYASDTYRSASPSLDRQDDWVFGIKVTQTLPDLYDYGLFSNSTLEAGYSYYTQSLGVSAHNVMFGVRFRF